MECANSEFQPNSECKWRLLRKSVRGVVKMESEILYVAVTKISPCFLKSSSKERKIVHGFRNQQHTSHSLELATVVEKFLRPSNIKDACRSKKTYMQQEYIFFKGIQLDIQICRYSRKIQID